MSGFGRPAVDRHTTEPAEIDPEGRRLAVFIPSLAGAGAERVVVNLLPGFIQAGLNVDLLIVRPGGELEAEVPHQVQTVVLRGHRLLTALPDLSRYLRQRQPDAVLAHLDFANLIALWAKDVSRIDTRIVLTVHNTMSKVSKGGGLKDRVLPYLARTFYSRAYSVVGVSQGVVSDLIEVTGLEDLDTHVIYNPIVSDKLLQSGAREGPDAASSEIAWPENSHINLVLGVGRLTPQKNFSMLIRAFEQVVRHETTARLAILGEGPQRQELQDLVRRLELEDFVRMPGYVDDPAPWFRAASVFTLSSDWEGLPTVLIEALAFGCSIVSTRCPSGPEEILAGGTYGRLVPPGNEDVMANGIIEALSDSSRAEELRNRARDFGIVRAVEQYLDVLFPGRDG